MDVAEILRRSNQASLDSLVPLIKIQTRTDMKRYAQNGYSVGITAKEFSEKYPLLPIENIYFSDNWTSNFLRVFPQNSIDFCFTEQTYRRLQPLIEARSPQTFWLSAGIRSS